MSDSLKAALTAVLTFVPKLLAFLLILVIGWLIAKALSKAVGKILQRIGFDRAVERGGIKKALEKSQYDASDVIGKIVYYALLLFVLQLAFGVFGPNPISDLLTRIIAFIPALIVAIIIVILAAAIAAAVKSVIQTALGGLSYGKTLASIASLFILFLGVVAALNQVGIATTVTTPVLIAILATIGGVIVVGAGGGLIKPMQARWENYLTKAEEEAPKIKQHAQQAPSAKEQAEQALSRVRQAAGNGGSNGRDSYVPAGYQPAPGYQAPPAGGYRPASSGGFDQPPAGYQPPPPAYQPPSFDPRQQPHRPQS